MVKDKLEGIRTYDDEGYRMRAACVCVKDETEKEVLLISAGRNKGYFIVPGGGIDPGEEAYFAAIREAHEEAGVRGHVKRQLGVFKNDKNKSKTAVYLLIVDEMDENWMEKSTGRIRKWFASDEAMDHLLANRQEHVPYLERLESLRC